MVAKVVVAVACNINQTYPTPRQLRRWEQLEPMVLVEVEVLLAGKVVLVS
jgi:hypothetical protein